MIDNSIPKGCDSVGKPSIQTTYAWNRNVWPTGGSERAFLLLELKGEADGARSKYARMINGNQLVSVVAQNVQVTFRPLSSGVSLTQIYGYQGESLEQGIRVALGEVLDQEKKSILLECAILPHAAGTHELLHMQWEYTDMKMGATLCTAEIHMEAEFTNNPNDLLDSIHPYVEKQVKFMELWMALERADQLFQSGKLEAGRQLLRQQADSLLRAAIILEDAELRKEAQLLYEQVEQRR